MSTIEAPSRWLDRVSDWSNPILVKETRQALKSRQFVVTFMLLLAASWLLSLFGMLLGGASIEFGSVGTEFFLMYFYILAFAVVILIPFGCYRSLLAEREQTTFELLSITALSPRQVIWGKLLSAGLQLFIFYSAIAPFIAFTSLLQGFDLAQVAFVLVAAILVSLIASMAALMVSSMVRQGVWQAIVSLIVLGGLFIIFLMTVSLTVEMQFWFDITDRDFLWVVGILVVTGLSYFALFQQIAVSQLTFESDNRATGIRMVCLAQFVLFWLGDLAFLWFGGTTVSASDFVGTAIVCATISALHWGVVGLFVVTEQDGLSKRVRRGLPRSVLLRIVLAPLLPGGARGFVYLLLSVAGLLVIGIWAVVTYAPGEIEHQRYMLSLCCYLLIYLGMGCALGRWCGALSHDIRPGHVRVLTLILFAVGCIGPYVPLLFGVHYSSSYHPVMITNPLATLIHLSDGRYYSSFIVPVLGAGAGVAVMVNLQAMFRGIREVVLADGTRGQPR